jgi:hypothetical protein
MAWLPHSIAEASLAGKPDSEDFGPRPEGVRKRLAEFLRSYDATG